MSDFWTFVFLLLFSIPSLLRASFDDLGVGAKAIALGGAYTAIADDAYSLYYNPAGLAQIKRQEVSTEYGLMHTGLDDKSNIRDSFFGYVYPAKVQVGTFGLGWQQLSLTNSYSERAITLGYGRRLSQKWSLGSSLRHLNVSIEPPEGVVLKGGTRRTDIQDPAFASGNTGSALGLDFGGLYRVRKNYTLGFALQNLNEPNVAVSANGRDIVPTILRGGLAYREEDVMILAELTTKKTLEADRDYNFTAGAEKKFIFGNRRNEIAMRGAFSYGSRAYRQFSMGLGYSAGVVQLDYAFVIPLSEVSVKDTGAAHRLSLTFRFGKNVAEPDYRAWYMDAMEKARRAQEKLEAVQSDDRDMLKDSTAADFNKAIDHYWRRKLGGASLLERKKLLKEIESRYKGTSVETNMVREELEVVTSEMVKAAYELGSSWKYYQRIAAREASVPLRIEILSQMIEKFAATGVDLSFVVSELNALKEQRIK